MIPNKSQPDHYASEDLDGLHGTPECPVLMLPKPFWPHQIEETLRLTLRP